MRLTGLLIFFVCMFWCARSSGQTPNPYAQPRILVLLDESSSMLKDWTSGDAKIKVANQIILRLIDSVYAVNPDVEFSLRVFGNQSPVPEHNCTDTRNEVPFSKRNRTQMEFRLEDLQPLGITAIAYSLSKAAEEDLVDEGKYVYSIVLITDGGESCNGDICAVMATLLKNKIYFRPYVLSLDDLPGLKKEYECLGNYLPVTDNTKISTAVSTIVESFRPMFNLTKVDYKLIKLKAPSILNISSPESKIKKADTVVTKPVVTTPVKPAVTDTPKPRKTAIVVGEEVKLPPPVRMKRTAFAPFKQMFVPPVAAFKPMTIKIPRQDLTLLEPELAPLPQSRLTATAFIGYRKLPVKMNEVKVVSAIKLPELKLNYLEPPAVAPTPVTLQTAQFTGYKNMPVAKAAISKLNAIKVGKVTLHYEEPDQEPKQPVALSRPRFGTFAKMPVTTKPFSPVAMKLPKVKLNLLQPPVDTPVTQPVATTPEVPTPARERITLIRPRFTRFKLHLLYGGSFFDNELKPLKLPPPKPLNLLQPTPAGGTATTTPVKKQEDPRPEIGEYNVTREDAAETSVQVYITNGKGKYYTTTPRLKLMDPSKTTEVKQFYRTVDEQGNPDPVKNIAAGKYNLGIVGRPGLVYPVEIIAGKRNKINIIVKGFSLFFYYEDALERPVAEFSAVVIQRNVPNGKVVQQRCIERLEYEPGNYHISINTLPEEVRNIDLDISYAGGVGILQPGFAKFVANSPIDEITLWVRRGDHFLSFYRLNMKDPKAGHLQLQPGQYQAHFNTASKFSSSEKVIDFSIKSTQETVVTLN